MQNELQKSFDEYLSEFNKLSIEKKRSEIISSLRELIDSIIEMAENEQLPMQYLQSELINKESYDSEEEYQEALLIYIENAKNILAQYLLQIQ